MALTPIPQADGRIKNRPVIILRELPEDMAYSRLVPPFSIARFFLTTGHNLAEEVTFSGHTTFVGL